ncbi:MAG: hypothetical protein VYA30_10390 [Myxococcota bacterium]|nr:hypothetical protein [Myxococcota bacterium]
MKAILLLCGLLLSCGGQPSAGVKHWDPPEAGTGLFYLRYNLPNALLDRLELGFEIKAGAGWERVSIAFVNESEGALLKLQQQVERAPNQTLPVLGELSSDLVGWAGNHHCRRLKILESDSAKLEKRISENPP